LSECQFPLRKCKASYWKLSGHGSVLNLTPFCQWRN